MITSDFHPNLRTRQLLDVIEQIIDVAHQSSKRFAFGAGIALEIEAAYNRGASLFTRDHADIDIHPVEEDVAFWQDWFEDQGYLISANEGIKDQSKAFVAYSPDSKNYNDPEKGSYYLDVYGLLIDDNEDVHSRETGKDDPWNCSWDDAFVQVKWKGKPVWVMKHKVALRNKRETAKAMGQELREKDVHDHMLFGEDVK